MVRMAVLRVYIFFFAVRRAVLEEISLQGIKDFPTFAINSGGSTVERGQCLSEKVMGLKKVWRILCSYFP